MLTVQTSESLIEHVINFLNAYTKDGSTKVYIPKSPTGEDKCRVIPPSPSAITR